MLELSANIEFMFADRDFVDRLDAVVEAGLTSFEFGEWRHRDMSAIVERARRYGLTQSNLGVDPRVRLTEEGNSDAFLRGIRLSAEMARRLGCKRLGTVVDDVQLAPGRPWYEYQRDAGQREERRRQRAVIVGTLKQAAPVAEGEGMLLVVECLNTLVDHADHYLASWQEGVSIIREVDSPAIRLTFDMYHHQINEGNIISGLTRHIDCVGHIHLADVPGRHEPGTGEINFRNVLRAAKWAGYSGYLGLECIPSKSDVKSALTLIRKMVEEINGEAS